MQVGAARAHQQGIVAGLAAAAQGNPFGAARAAYTVGKQIYNAMPSSKRKKAPSSRSRKRVRKTTKAPGGGGSLRQRKPYSRRVAYRKSRKCRTMGRRKLSKKVCHLESAIKGLKFSENASLGTFIHRNMGVHGPVLCNAASTRYGVAVVEGLVMADFNDSIQYLKYYDPATPGTLTVADGKTGTYDRRFLFKSAHCSIQARNNYQTDIKLKVYLCTPKQSSTIGVTTAWQNGVTANQDTSFTSYLDYGQYPNDYSDFKDTWTAKLHCKATLTPGQTMTCSHGVKNIEYDPTAFASHNAAYQSKYKNFKFLVVVEGTLGHNSTAANGLIRGGVDLLSNRVRIVNYDAGVNVKFIKVENGTADQTTGAVQSAKPVADNIGYSQT